MKRFHLLAIGLALSLGLVLTGQASAQATGTKVAVVNVGEVFQKYEKAVAFKNQLEKIVGPRKDQAKALQDQIKGWQEAMKHPKFDVKEKDRYEQAILANVRKFEDLERQVKSEIGKTQEGQIIALYKDLNMAVEATAKTQGYHLVLAYGDIPSTSDRFSLENINRLMNGMDLGSTTPLFFHGSADITGTVISTLNDHHRRTAGVTGAGGPAPVAPVTPVGGKGPM